MTKTMLTVFVLTVVLTACDVLGDDPESGEGKYCDLDLAQKLCMENFNLTKADGHWDLMFGYKVSPTFQNYSRMSQNYLHDAPGTPPNATQFKETVVMKDGTCKKEEWNYNQTDCPGKLTSGEVTQPDDTTNQYTINVLVTDYQILVFRIQKRMKAGTWNNIGVLVRDPGATLDWSAVDDVLTKICGPRPDDGNWAKFFNKFDFDWDATCQD